MTQGNRHCTIAVGRSRMETVWHNKEVSWDWLLKKLADCKVTEETVADYASMSKDDKAGAKDVGGFVGGSLGSVNGDKIVEGKRNSDTVMSRSLVALDIDYGREDTIGVVQDALAGQAWCLYSTHSHTKMAPRYRIIVPLSRDVTADEYGPVARRIADDIGIDLFDDSTYEPSRLMFWPSRPSDGDFVFVKGEGPDTDPDALLSSYPDWRNAIYWPVSSRVGRLREKSGRKMEDPMAKAGAIGLFCRTYSISEAIAAFLSDVYAPTDRPDRYTYIKGSTASGAVTYEDKWIYSHHSTDRLGGRAANAFDLVRIHLFEHLDEGCAPETPVNRLPSFTAMESFALSDDRVRALRSEENISATTEKVSADNDDWMQKLEWTQRKGKPDMLDNTPKNFRLVLENHPDWKDAVVFDTFANERVFLRDVPGHRVEDGKYWRDANDRALVQWFADAPWNTQGKQNIMDTAQYVAEKKRVHPVKEYLESLPEWDGVQRLDKLVIDYLGAADNELNRAMTRKHFCAAVRRIYEPGCKHDGVLCFDGPQGIGKSTLVAKMFGKWFSDTSITVEKTNETALALQGTWGKELAELTDYKKSTVEAYKNFISSTEDKVRVPYDRSYQYRPRQCVLFATTNDKNFLKGSTGNRRFWIIPCKEFKPTKDIWKDLPGERDQIWAEALAKYKGETSELGPLEKELEDRQMGHNELADDIRIDAIRAYMEELVPKDWSSYPRSVREEWEKSRTIFGTAYPDDILVRRPPVCYQEIATECLHVRYDLYTQKNIRDLLDYIGVEHVGVRRDVIYGAQKRVALKSCSEPSEQGQKGNEGAENPSNHEPATDEIF